MLLAAVAVAMAARRYTQRHLDSVALMKCMGAPQRARAAVTVIELALIALVAAVVGTALGFLAQECSRGCWATWCGPTCRRRRSRP